EHTVGMLLCLLNKINQANLKVKEGIWDRNGFRGEELMGKTVGILGYGNMGKAVAARLSSFSCQVIAYDKYLPELPDNNAIQVELETFFEETEVLTIHLPLTPETRGMVNGEFLSKFRKPLILIHTARGPILPITDLTSEIESGKVRMAALDVLEKEPPVENLKKNYDPYSRLFDMDQVLLTPHVAGWSLESYRKISEVLARKIEVLISSVPN
ncbi:MAG TPA: NAD(P)-dependent oxidoreductase, partial [Catalimonadaceae bacterium]|nr:NAD(P)-dependent oxidoreductase [Catalimonadaceae bacterium]